MIGRMRESGHTKLAEIEGLRAVAVILVVLYHLGVTRMAGGYIGVDVFFVVSGFLITGLLLREVEGFGRISLAGFWARRIRRIVPMATLVAVATVVAGFVIFERNQTRQLIQVGLGAVGFCANLVLDSLTGDYLAGVVNPSPLQHYWSLGVEEQFYVVWPLVVFVVLRVARNRWRPALFLTAIVAISASMWASVHHVQPGVPSGYFLPQTRAWEILIGALLAMVATLFARMAGDLRAALGWVGLTAVMIAAFRFDAETPFPGTAALLPVLGAAAVIIAGDSPRGPVVLLRMRPLQYIGGVSFALYLWHWPLIVFSEHLYGKPNAAGQIAIVALALLLAHVSRIIIENPIRWNPWLSVRPSRSIVAGLVAVSAFLGVGVVALRNTPVESTTVASFAPLEPVTTTVAVDNAPTSVVDTSVAATTTVPTPPPVKPVRAYLLGDSTMAVLRWFEQGSVTLQGFQYLLDAEGCRRLYYQSCESRELRVPDEAVNVIPTIDVSQYDVLVVMVGYHSRPDSFEKELTEVGNALAATGLPVIFVNYKESMTFPESGSQGKRSVYTGFNETLARFVAEGRMGNTQIADWNRFSYQHPEWFRPDGIHSTVVGTVALGWFLSMTIAAKFDNPCPFDGGYPCVVPEMDDGSIDYLTRFGVEYTDIHCYQDREERRRNCRVDRRITATDL